MPVIEKCDGLSLNRGIDPPERGDRSLSGREPRNHPKQEEIDPPRGGGGIDPFLAAMKHRSRNSFFFLNLTKACPWEAIQRHQNNPKHMRGRKQDSYQDIYRTKSSMKDSIIHKMIKCNITTRKMTSNIYGLQQALTPMPIQHQIHESN